jgi:hypothetical protein
MSGPDGDYVYTISADNVVHRVPVLVEARQEGLAVFTKGQAIQAATALLPKNLPNPPTYKEAHPADAPILIYAVTL